MAALLPAPALEKSAPLRRLYAAAAPGLVRRENDSRGGRVLLTSPPVWVTYGTGCLVGVRDRSNPRRAARWRSATTSRDIRTEESLEGRELRKAETARPFAVQPVKHVCDRLQPRATLARATPELLAIRN